MEEIILNKKIIRKRISAAKKLCSKKWMLEKSALIFNQIEQLAQFRDAKTILLYYSLPDEVQTEEYISKWCKLKRIVLPLVKGDELLLKLYDVNKIEDGYRSIKEPSSDSIDVSPQEIDLAIIPGVAFDRQFNRLGRGKGFYDRILPKLKCKKIGICYNFQIIDKVPTESFDAPLDLVISTPKYEHIVFDIDGTILDTEQTGLISLQKTIKEFLGVDKELSELYKYFGIPSKESVIELGFEDPTIALHRWEYYYQTLLHLVHPFEGVVKSLIQLKAKGYKLGILTSRSLKEIKNDPNLQSFIDLFEITICSEDSIKHKPHPDPMFSYLNKSKANRDSVLYIGDTIYDYNCAKGAEVDFALISWGSKIINTQNHSTSTIINYDFLIHNAEELEQLFFISL